MASPDKVVLISGATSGIGLSIATHFATNGWRVFAGYRSAAKVKEITAAAKSYKVEHLVNAVELDVLKNESVLAAVAHVLNTAGRLDVVVNNAGSGQGGAVEQLAEADLVRQMDLNFYGAFRLTQAVLPGFRTQKSGRIVQISSVLGVISFPFLGAYSASKFALEALSQSLAAEVAGFGIHVSLVQPSYTKTPFAIDDPTRKIEVPAYSEGMAGTKAYCAAQLANGAPAETVAIAVWQAATDAQPKFRYQPTYKISIP